MYALNFEELLLLPGTAEPLGAIGVLTGGEGTGGVGIPGVGASGVDEVLVNVDVWVTV